MPERTIQANPVTHISFPAPNGEIAMKNIPTMPSRLENKSDEFVL